jgi:predicted amidohydrolase
MSIVALAQMTSGDDVTANVGVADELVAEASARGAELLAFPENVFCVGSRERKLAVAEPVDGPLVSHFRELAARRRMLILLGSVHERIPHDPTRVFNTSVLIGAGGEVLMTYRKRKLFEVDVGQLQVRESDTIAAGEEAPPVVATPLGRVGLTICFDLRFPELYQDLRRRGAEIVFVPSNFTSTTGIAHWDVLLRARAVENQVWVAAPAQWGRHAAAYTSHGSSMLVDPWGTVVARAPDATGLVVGSIDLDYLRKVRRELPMGVEEG